MDIEKLTTLEHIAESLLTSVQTRNGLIRKIVQGVDPASHESERYIYDMEQIIIAQCKQIQKHLELEGVNYE